MDRDRGTYTPPTEDNLSYTPRRTPPRDQAPLTLIISGIILVVVLIVGVILLNSSLTNRNKVAPEVGDTLSDLKDTKITEAQPLPDDVDSDADGSAAARFANDTEQPGLRSASADSDLAPAPVAPIKGPLPSQAGNPAVTGATSSSATVSSASASSAVSKSLASVAAPASASGTAAVQIGAFTSQDIANSEYAKVASSFGLFVGGAGKRIEKVQTPAGTFYRTAFTGLSVDKAKSFCSALKAAGHDCLVR